MPFPDPPPNTPSVTNLDWRQLDPSSITPQETPFRVLILPRAEHVKISAHGGASRPDNWVEVNTGNSGEPTKLFALGANKEYIGCSVTHDDIHFIMYFNTEHRDDHLVLYNRSEHPFHAVSLYGDRREEVGSWAYFELTVGEWLILTDDERLIEVKVLERDHWRVIPSLSSKRPAEESAVSQKKVRLSAKLGFVRDQVRVGVGELSYTLKHLAITSDHPRTRVCRAQHSEIPGKVVAVKVVKTANAGEDATVYAAESWLRETAMHSSIGNHVAVAHYLGADARFHSIYTEYVNAPTLKEQRDLKFRFTGNRVMAWRILSDMAGALSFLHEQKIAHGDVKLDNILYNPMRGAVLIDFATSFKEGKPIQGGGSPWYLPPEYLLDWRLRSPASDIWALGVVMMWVLGRIPLPESTASWNIGDLHPYGTVKEANTKAQERMRNWGDRVQDARVLPDQQPDEIQEIVNGLLEEQEGRTTAANLVQQVMQSNLVSKPVSEQ
ncbi:kinase-like domain-containing protein [Xylaria palmicola]|nr:kinase-like domain-containing protein [Xylaria palmicola]